MEMSLGEGLPSKGNRKYRSSQNSSEPPINKEQGPSKGKPGSDMRRRNLFTIIPTTQEFIFIKAKPWVSQHGWAKPPECEELDS